MKSLTRYLTYTMPERMGFRNITGQVEQLVAESGVREGLALVKTIHRWDTLDRVPRWPVLE